MISVVKNTCLYVEKIHSTVFIFITCFIFGVYFCLCTHQTVLLTANCVLIKELCSSSSYSSNTFQPKSFVSGKKYSKLTGNLDNDSMVRLINSI